MTIKNNGVIQMNQKRLFSLESIFLACLFFTALILAGCVTVDNGYKIERADDISKTQILSKSGNELLSKDLPDMTSDEYERLGDTLLSKGKLHLAYLQYERSLKINPDNLRVEYKKGLTLLVGKKNTEAIEQFNTILKHDCEYALAFEGLGRAFYQEKKFGEAEINFRKAIELNPKLWKSHNYLGNIYDYQKEYEKAVTEYKFALAIKPNNGSLYNNLGVSYSLAGKYKKAISAFDKAIAVRYIKSKVYNNLGVALSNLGRYSEALEAFKKGGGEARAYNNLGCIYLNHGMFKDAIRCFEKAIEIDPIFYAKANENLRRTENKERHQD